MQKRLYIPDLWIGAAIFAANLLILGPYLLTDFSDQPWNNGYIYAAISRMFRDHHWTWSALQYGGAPLRYLYPPIFHVLIGALPVGSLGRAFHLVAGFGYALAPVCLYVLARQLFRWRPLAAFAAAAYSLFPSLLYLFMPTWRGLAQPYGHAPWQFVALVGYDEAGHAFGLPLTFLVIAAAWRGRWRTAAVLAAGVLLINWPALIGLGFPLAGLAVARSRDLGPVKAAACTFGVAGAAYGLSAFWMTPGYFVSSTLLNRVVLRHAPFPATPWNWATWLILLAAAALVGLAFWRRIPATISLLIVWIALSGAVVVSYTLLGNALLPSPNRYILEMNACMPLALAGAISLAPWRWRPATVGALTVVGCVLAFGFLTRAWKVQPGSQDPRTGPAYETASWLNRNNGNARVFVSGELDSTLNLWSNVPQVGGSGQDISNFLIFAAERQVAFGCRADSDRIAQLWLRALNVKHLVVHHAESREYFHWFSQPEKFRTMPVAWDNGAGDTVYRVPDSGDSDAVVVDLAELGRLPRLRSTDDSAFLEAYVKWAAGKRPAGLRWIAEDRAGIDAELGPGEAILVKSNYDIGWRVSAGSIESDPIGFLLIRAGAGRQSLALRFGASWETWLGRAIAALTLILLRTRVRIPWIGAAAVVPAVAAYAVLLSSVPPTVAAAEETFVRVRPPIISPRGIVDQATYQQPPLGRGRLVSVWGTNFGVNKEVVRVWVSGRQAEVATQGPQVIDFTLPADAPPQAEISVEVNGCRGNVFAVATR